jgi:Ras-related GTP-binding protein C/D
LLLYSGHHRQQKIIFQKMTPHETLFRLEPTQKVEQYLINHTPLCSFTLWDFAGDDYGDDDLQAVFAGGPATSLIFVLDAQDEPYDHALQSFTHVVTRALQVNPTIAIEIFINKVRVQ